MCHLSQRCQTYTCKQLSIKLSLIDGLRVVLGVRTRTKIILHLFTRLHFDEAIVIRANDGAFTRHVNLSNVCGVRVSPVIAGDMRMGITVVREGVVDGGGVKSPTRSHEKAY